MKAERKRPKRPWWIYILRCADGSFYTGVTPDVRGRLEKHLAGAGSKYVASRLPAGLAWSRRAGSRSRALRLEAAIKGMPRPEKKALILGLVKPLGLPRSRKPRPSGG